MEAFFSVISHISSIYTHSISFKYVSKLLGDRSTTEVPLIFNSPTALTKLFSDNFEAGSKPMFLIKQK